MTRTTTENQTTMESDVVDANGSVHEKPMTSETLKRTAARAKQQRERVGMRRLEDPDDFREIVAEISPEGAPGTSQRGFGTLMFFLLALLVVGGATIAIAASLGAFAGVVVLLLGAALMVLFNPMTVTTLLRASERRKAEKLTGDHGDVPSAGHVNHPRV